VLVGRLDRASVPEGKASFSVALGARGKNALRQHHRLAHIVRVSFTPVAGAGVGVVRGVVLRE